MGFLTLAPRVARVLRYGDGLHLGACAGFQGQPLRGRGDRRRSCIAFLRTAKGKLLADLGTVEIHAIVVDSKDRIYVSTSPDGKIHRISGNGKPEVFYDPKAKYIWAMLFDSRATCIVATGDQGEIHRVTPDGKGKVFFKSDETHVRSMAMDPTTI